MTHWCLAHYLLDGHHKLCTASQAGKPISLLSFLAMEKGVSSAEQIAKVLKVLAQEQGIYFHRVEFYFNFPH